MANYFVNLPSAKMPGNALLDLAGINNSLDGIRQQKNADTARSDMLDQRNYQRGREAVMDQRQASDWFGKQAAAVERMQGPQRAAAWQNIIAKHPQAAQLGPEYLDPLKGPAMVAAEAGQFVDPLERQMSQAKLNLLHAQAQKTRMGDVDPYGKAGTILQGADGKYYSVQFGSGGQRKIEPLDVGGTAMQPAKGVDVAGNIIYDKTTGREIRDIGQNLQAGEQAKVTGRETAEARVKAAGDLPRIEDNARFMLETIDKAQAHPGKALGMGPVAGRLPAIGGNQAGFVSLMDQIQGKTFLEAFNSLRGGGQITEAEGRKATEALARLNRVQNERDFNDAMSDLRAVVNAGAERARRSAGAGAQQAPAQPQSIQPGTVMQGYRFKGGNPADQNSWEPVQ